MRTVLHVVEARSGQFVANKLEQQNKGGWGGVQVSLRRALGKHGDGRRRPLAIPASPEPGPPDGDGLRGVRRSKARPARHARNNRRAHCRSAHRIWVVHGTAAQVLGAHFAPSANCTERAQAWRCIPTARRSRPRRGICASPLRCALGLALHRLGRRVHRRNCVRSPRHARRRAARCRRGARVKRRSLPRIGRQGGGRRGRGQRARRQPAAPLMRACGPWRCVF